MFYAITAFLLSRFEWRLTASLGWCLSSNSCEVLCRLTEGIHFLSNSYTCTLQSWGGVSKVGNMGARPLFWSMSERMPVIMTCLPDSCFCTLCNLIFITYTSNIIINSPSSSPFFSFFFFLPPLHPCIPLPPYPHPSVILSIPMLLPYFFSVWTKL